jgi:hypothetical protein
MFRRNLLQQFSDFAIEMEALYYFKTLITAYQSAWFHIPENRNLKVPGEWTE